MRRTGRWGVGVALLAAAVVAAAFVGVGRATSEAKAPIVIGYAYDSKGQMSPFDVPALAAAQLQIQAINAKGGVNGRRLRMITCDTQNNNPAKSKSCAASMLDKGAKILFVTCDVEFSAPATQEAINRGILAVAPCIGTDQMGPKRFGARGRLAFSYGNVAQDEGSAMAEYAYRRGWRRASIATDNLLIYFKNVTAAFEKRFTQLGGRIATKESYTSGDKTIQNVVSRLNGQRADVIVTSEAFGELPAMVSGLRSLGNNTPILNSWAGDGTYWVPKEPKVTNYYYVTFASAFGDDPSPAVRALVNKLKAQGKAPATGGFVTGAAAVDGVVTAIKRAKGSTSGARLALIMESYKNVPAIGGTVSFSKKLHTVFGRQYRVMQIQDNKAKYIGTVRAKVVPTL
jgi:branched-chain amino acid transport system substrate-binding protein